MTLRQSVDSFSRTPTIRVYLANKQVRIANVEGAVTLSQSFGQPISGGTIQLRDEVAITKHKTPVEIHWGYDGFTVPAFTGFVTNPTRNAYPKVKTLQIRDILWLADFTVEDAIIALDNKTHDLHGTPPTDYFGLPNWIKASEVIIRLLRDWAGIPESRLVIPELYTDAEKTKPWYLGTLTPVSWSGMSPLQICLQIASTLGYWLYCDPAGMIRMTQMSGAPTSQMAYVWREGERILVKGAPTTDEDIDKVYNQVLVQGANTGVEGAQIRDKWAVAIDLLPDGKHRTLTVSNQLIEYVNEAQSGEVSCTGVARRYAKEYARYPETISLTVKAVPFVGAGSTVGIRVPRLDINTDKPYFIQSISTTFGAGRFESQITLDGGVGPDGYTLIPPPIAAFTYSLMQETISFALNDEPNDIIEIFVDGGASTALGGAEIVSWDWSCSTPGVLPPVGSGRYFTFIVPAFDAGISTVEITLTVTDTNSKTGTITQTIPIGGDDLTVPATRELNIAAGPTWYVTGDGGKTYADAQVGVTRAVPPISATGSVDADADVAATLGFLATGGGSGNTVYSSPDLLATPPVVLGNASGPINFMWQHEANAMRVWVAVGNGVQLSVDGGLTFGPLLAPTLPVGETDSTCRWVVESKDTEGVLDILVGRFVYTSFDAGANWVVALEGPAGSIARNYVSGFDRHWAGFTNLPEGASPLRSTEGDTAAWPPEITPPVTEARAITLMVKEPTLIVVDQIGRIWKLNAKDGGSAVLSTNLVSMAV